MTELEEAQKQLQEVQAKIDKLVEEEAKPKKWEWSYERDSTFFIGTTSVHTIYSEAHYSSIEHGRCRRTEEQAEYSLLRNKRANRLEALAMEIGGLYEWKECSERYYINYANNKWNSYYASTYHHPEVVYMSKETAMTICKMLNEGTYSLDKEL